MVNDGRLFIVGTPIGNLEDLTFRAVKVLKSVDEIYCEDTRRTQKLLRHIEATIPLISCPQGKERQRAEEILEKLKNGKRIAYCSDAGMPGLQDPGQHLVAQVRKAHLPVEIIDGPSAVPHFLAGIGYEFETFRYVGFLPARKKDRMAFFAQTFSELTVFFESPHRLEGSLELVRDSGRQIHFALAKELTKLQEAYFFGEAESLLQEIPSFKGEWVGAIFPEDYVSR